MTRTESTLCRCQMAEKPHPKRSTLISSQLPVEDWHDAIGKPSLDDAIPDRLIHNAYRNTRKGESMRKPRAAAMP